MARARAKNVGLIGLGIIGSRVATTLRKRGLDVYVWNRTPRPEQNFVGSPAEVAELCDVVQLFVADDQALQDVVRQLAPALTAEHVITAHSTVSPDAMRAAAEVVQRRTARFLDAPFTGSKIAAENGQLVYYIGGDDAALRQARPILEASSKEIVRIGEIGDASLMKVATNLVTAATAQVGAEALALLRKAGVPPELFLRAMKSNASNSTTLEMKLPKMLEGDFEPHFSAKHMLKDVRIACGLAKQFGLDVPVTETAREVLAEQLEQGNGDADYACVALRYFPPPGTPGSDTHGKDSAAAALAQADNAKKKEESLDGVNLSGGIRNLSAGVGNILRRLRTASLRRRQQTKAPAGDGSRSARE